jgi:DNA polymerase III subunit epsilon
MRQIVLDTETTGLGPKEHRIIEVAALELNGRNVSDRTFHRYINPERDIDEGAAAVHGLTLDRLQDEAKFAEVAPSLLEFIQGAQLIIHNAPFDMGFLNAELARMNLPPLENEVIDTLKLAKELHPGQKNNLNALCHRYFIDNSQRTLHGALLDTELLAEVYLGMTRGQESLLGDDATLHEEHHTNVSADPLPPVLVWAANDTELALHVQQLNDIQKASKGACVWQGLNT